MFEPLWSARLLGEWARAAIKLGPEGEAQARAEIALLRAAWPKAEVPPSPGVAARLYLPDENDVHVLAAAITGHADAAMIRRYAGAAVQKIRATEAQKGC